MKPDKNYDLILKERKVSKSLSQLRYVYWAFNYIADQLGVSPVEVKVTLKWYVGERISEKDVATGENISSVMSLSLYNVEKMMQFIDNIRSFSEEQFGIRVPEPNELSEDELRNFEIYAEH